MNKHSFVDFNGVKKALQLALSAAKREKLTEAVVLLRTLNKFTDDLKNSITDQGRDLAQRKRRTGDILNRIKNSEGLIYAFRSAEQAPKGGGGSSIRDRSRAQQRSQNESSFPDHQPRSQDTGRGFRSAFDFNGTFPTGRNDGSDTASNDHAPSAPSGQENDDGTDSGQERRNNRDAGSSAAAYRNGYVQGCQAGGGTGCSEGGYGPNPDHQAEKRNEQCGGDPECESDFDEGYENETSDGTYDSDSYSEGVSQGYDDAQAGKEGSSVDEQAPAAGCDESTGPDCGASGGRTVMDGPAGNSGIRCQDGDCGNQGGGPLRNGAVTQARSGSIDYERDHPTEADSSFINTIRFTFENLIQQGRER